MLNISKSNINKSALNYNAKTLKEVESKVSSKVLRKTLYTSLIILIIILFLPWTQNVRTTGRVTSIQPNQTPQTINSIIGGQIDKWYVKEGDVVEKGDTILRVKETKDAYFDNKLLERTKQQIELKKQAIVTYQNKIQNYQNQKTVLKQQYDLKINQTKNKLQQVKLKNQSDSIAYITSVTNYNIALYQFQRTDSLYKSGLKSLTQLEQKKVKLQQTENYKIKAENTWLNSKTEVINTRINLDNLLAKFNMDINKIESTIISTNNDIIKTETELTKLENTYSNYSYRLGLYYITSPQKGYITKVKSAGVGVVLKPGESILTLMPIQYDLACEIYIKPVDLPLMKIGQKVRIQFDGWPAIVFSGWPNVSHGTYGGEIYAIDQYISPNGKFRLLVKPDPDDCEWPDAIRYGGGVNSLIMLTDVPVWYELWRNINGFPPNYYKNENKDIKTVSKEKS